MMIKLAVVVTVWHKEQVVRQVKRNNKNRGLKRPFKVRPDSQSKQY